MPRDSVRLLLITYSQPLHITHKILANRVHRKTKDVSTLASAWTTEVADTSLNLLNFLAAGNARTQYWLLLLAKSLRRDGGTLGSCEH